jgi:hypothetical protein
LLAILGARCCHWIDHFLLLNDYVPLKSYGAIYLNNEDIVCWAELENGSTFNMVVTTHGSMRLGYRETIEIRSKDSTVRINDLSCYTAEGHNRVIRRVHIKKPEVYINAYKTISRNILAGHPGDTIKSLARTSILMLCFEDSLKQLKINTNFLQELDTLSDIA